jgi:hypothetical protein
MLRQQLEHHIDQDRFESLQTRPGESVVTYHELFPSFRPVHHVDFEKTQDLIDAVCHSSAFPFFASDWPVAVKHSDRPATTITLGTQKFDLKVPRLFVDGHFAVPGERFGCPDFEIAGVNVDRTILVTVFPREIIGLAKGIPSEDCICPQLADDGGISQSLNLLKLATQPSEPSELIAVYDAGYADAERWCRNEENRRRRDVEEQVKNDRLLL